MLFNSLEFIFIFLPLVLAVFYFIGASGYAYSAQIFLTVASFGFYSYWNPAFLPFLVVSIIFNFVLSRTILQTGSRSDSQIKWLMGFRIALNLLFLGFFKYTNFFVNNLNSIFEMHIPHQEIKLPLAISFYTFTEIAYLVDVYKRRTEPANFKNYCFFVVFFPHLIAGPIVHYRDLMPRFLKNFKPEISTKKTYFSFDQEDFLKGLYLFIFGLFKKVVIADFVAKYSSPVFHLADSGLSPIGVAAWGGAFAYTFQIYFDFSGYSDMAIGLARMFRIRFPLNFNSPYQAESIIDFWRRWHITLSTFLRDYLYIPLGGNRKGPTRRYVNLSITMLLGGLWHGAGWNFIIWGLLHAIYLVVNHSWHNLRTSSQNGESFLKSVVSRGISFLAVLIAWVFFRAETFSGALRMLKSMFGVGGFSLPLQYETKLGPVSKILKSAGARFTPIAEGQFEGGKEIAVLVLLFLITQFLPNSQEIVGIVDPHVAHQPTLAMTRFKGMNRLFQLTFSPGVASGFLTGLILMLAIMSILLNRASEFLYFNF